MYSKHLESSNKCEKLAAKAYMEKSVVWEIFDDIWPYSSTDLQVLIRSIETEKGYS